MQAPQGREARCRDRVAKGVGRTTEHGRGLVDIVLQQPRLGERRADAELFIAREDGRTEKGREYLDGFRALTAFERGARAREQCVQGG